VIMLIGIDAFDSLVLPEVVVNQNI